MIQSHPEDEAWQARRFREAEQKKLFALHSQNQRLMAKQYEFEVVIADYAHKIDSFSQKSKKFEEENKQLKAEVESLNSKNKKIDDLLNKRNEEYCQLYNYLFTEKRGTIQEAIFKEIDLHNRLNQIQHQSDTQIINKLRQTIKCKNQELLKNSLRISELNEALLTSSYQYQEKINILKDENERLQRQAMQKQSLLPVNDNINEYCLQKKVQGLQRQIALYQKQLQNTKKELTSYRKNYNSLESDRKYIQAELNTIKNNLPTFDRSVYDFMAENRILKQSLEDQRVINQTLQSLLPEMTRKSQEFNNFINSKSTESKLKHEIEGLKDQLKGLNDEINTLRIEHKASNQAKLAAEMRYASLQLVSTSAVEKLKEVISTYVPYYFRRGGLENYNLSKEQQQFLAQRNVEKTLQAAYQQINARISEAHQAKQRQNESQQKITQQKEKIRQLQIELTRSQGQIQKYTQSIESLMQEKRNHDCSFNNRYGYQGGYHDEDVDQIANSEDQYISRVQPAGEPLEKSYQIKISILEKAIEQFQADRSQLINIIKGKQLTIAELSGEIEALKNTEHINQLNVQILSNLDSRRQSFERHEDMNEEAAEIQPYLNEVREQLRRVSEEYNLEKESLIKEYERKEALSLNKYNTLLKHFNELMTKYNSLEASTNNNLVQQANSQNQENSSASQLPLDVPETVHQPQRDQATISESAIENFTDTLKKYEKEFNRFVGIYEAQIKKSMQNSMISEIGHESEGESQPHSEDPVDKLQNLLNQHSDTIKHLENLIQQKAQQYEIEVKYLQDELNQKKESVFTLETRLEQAQTTIADLKALILTQKTGEEFTSSESANTAFLILNAKNKQIDELRSTVQKLRRSYEEKCKEVAKLGDLQVVDSRVQAEELRVFKEIMQQQNLVGVLEAVAQRLQ